ncbi:protein AF-10 [Megalops cyprinoides]|uniref:protein AF-10 n=1 Tax=Megalops cyprinoides TaxID=118141 RepID=UPI0018645F64|nr:protein AF-10 [Megalops cyprinoides]
MVSSEPSLAVEDDYFANNMKEMIGGCCVCSDERGWAENPLVYCDGHGCNVAVHQACYGIVQVPTGPWFCRKCESQERAARVIKGWKGRKPSQLAPDGGGRSTSQHRDEEDERLAKSLKTMNTWRCELCPHKDGALKRTDNGGWAHVVCALYIPEVEFANVSTMEPIVLQSVPHERYNKTCYICEEQGRESKAATGACMTCNKHGCRQAFHVTCAQFAGLLCEEQGSDADNVKYCGYCKYHYSKLRRSKGRSSRAQSLSDSSSHSLDKHHDKDKKKHKDRDRHKPKYKRVSEPSPALVPALMVSSEKTYSGGGSAAAAAAAVSASQKRLDDTAGRFTNANFQEVPAHPGGSSKDAGPADGKGAEGKGRRAGGHGSGQRGRKSAPGKPPLPAADLTAPAAISSSSSPFQQGLLLGSSGKSSSGGSANPPGQEFLSFSEPSLRNESSFGRCLPKAAGDNGAGEGVVTLTTFGSLMSPVPSSTSASAKHYENCHLAGEPGGLAPAGYKRPQASGAGGPGAEEAAKGKKRRCNWRNRYGPCRSRDLPELAGHPPVPSSSSSSSSSPSPSSSASSMPGRANPANGNGGGSGTGAGIQKSPSLLRNGSLQSLSVSSSPAGPGAFPSSDTLVSLPNAVTGTSAELPQQLSTISSLPSTPLLPPPVPSVPAGPLTSTACTHPNALPGSSLNLAPSHMFGNRLNPNSAMAALIAQSEGVSTDQEPGDSAHGFPGRGASPKATLSPRSPGSGLQIRYDPPGLVGPGPGAGAPDSLPPVATSIEQLLERQWSEGQQFLFQQGTQGDVLGMLKSLHQLQVENRRLEEQIKTLTLKKERLQLLSAQLSVPFPPASTAATSSSPELQTSNTPSDAINSSKSFHLGGSFLPDSSLNLASQDTASSGHSSSSSSLSTPPSAAHSPPQPSQQQQQQQQVNGIGVAGGAMQPVAPAAMPGVTGLMGSLQGAPLAMSGIVGALNGVIQSSPGLAQNSSPLSHPAVVPSAPLSIPSTLNSSSTAPVKTSVARLGLLSEQQRQILLHQHQLQQLFSSPQPTPQQQQALLYHLMQQQHQQHQQQHDLQQLQQLSSSQLPINSLLPAAQGAIAANPFLAMHADAGAQKTARLAEKAGAVAGQEKS